MINYRNKPTPEEISEEERVIADMGRLAAEQEDLVALALLDAVKSMDHDGDLSQRAGVTAFVGARLFGMGRAAGMATYNAIMPMVVAYFGGSPK